MIAFSLVLLVTLAGTTVSSASSPPQPAAAGDQDVSIRLNATGIEDNSVLRTTVSLTPSSRRRLIFTNPTTEPFDVTLGIPTPSELRGLASAASETQWVDALKKMRAGRGLPGLECARDGLSRQTVAPQTCVVRLRLGAGESAPLLLRSLISSEDPNQTFSVVIEVQRANAPTVLLNNRAVLRLNVAALTTGPAATAPLVDPSQTPVQTAPPAVTVISDTPATAQQTTRAPTRRRPAPPAAPLPPATVQEAAYLPCPLPTSQAEVSIALDNTGWTAEPYLNPRNPPYLFSEQGALTGEADIDAAYLSCLEEKIGRTAGFPKLKASLEKERDDYKALKDPPRRDWAQRYVYARTLSVRLVNRTIDRTFSITFNVPQPPELERRRFEKDDASLDEATFTAAKERFARTRGVHIGECRSDDTCTAVVTLAPGTVGSLSASVFITPASILARTKAGPLKSLPIELSASFFDVDLKPAYSRAFVSVVTVENLLEPASKTSWSVNASVSGVLAPLVGQSSVFSIAAPFNGERTRSYTGSGVLTLAQTLGNRADAEINVQYKTGVLGNDSATDKLTATTYRVTINSFVGSTISFGRMLVAAPSNGIAAFEQGDAIRYAYKRLAVSHIIRRESGLHSADPANRDDKSLIVDLSNVSGSEWGIFRSLNLYGSIGRDRDVMALKEKRHIDELKKAGKTDEADALSKGERLRRTYGTFGAEVFFSTTTASTSSLAIYHSRYKEQGLVLENRPRRGNGTVALFNYGRTFFGALDPTSPLRLPTKSSLNFQIGIGSGDDEETPNEDESYLGQTAAFAPDTFYLKQFAAKMDVESEGRTLRMPTLTNKRFVSGSWTAQTFSVAAWLMRQIGVPERDITYKASIFRVNYYHFGNAVNGQHAGGYEAFTDSQVHSPKGVEISLRGGKFWPGSALKPVLAKSPWTIVASITVKLTPP